MLEELDACVTKLTVRYQSVSKIMGNNLFKRTHSYFAIPIRDFYRLAWELETCRRGENGVVLA